MRTLILILLPFILSSQTVPPNILIDEDGISSIYPDVAEFHFSKETGTLLISLAGEGGSWSDIEYSATMTENGCDAVIIDLGDFDCAIINLNTGTTNLILGGINRRYSLEHCSRL